MAINVVDAATEKVPVATPGSGERMLLLLLLATQDARDIQKRSQEDAAIDAEDFWTQAEEACAVDPIG